MRSLEKEFERLDRENPGWPSNISFSEAVKGRNFSHQTIHRWFYQLVDPNDYDRQDTKIILSQIMILTKRC